MKDAQIHTVSFPVSGRTEKFTSDPAGFPGSFYLQVDLRVDAEIIFPGDYADPSLKIIACTGHIQPGFNDRPVGHITTINFKFSHTAPVEEWLAYQLPADGRMLEWLQRAALDAYYQQNQKVNTYIITTVEAWEVAA